jgi:hypothetical protein
MCAKALGEVSQRPGQSAAEIFNVLINKVFTNWLKSFQTNRTVTMTPARIDFAPVIPRLIHRNCELLGFHVPRQAIAGVF